MKNNRALFVEAALGTIVFSLHDVFLTQKFK
jgi:hypothetical protein